MNPRRLFLASCVALVATAMSFAVRGDIMGDLQQSFALTKTDIGWISGAAFWGFGVSILFGGMLCDWFGIGRLMRLAALGHISGVLLTSEPCSGPRLQLESRTAWLRRLSILSWSLCTVMVPLRG